RILTNAPGGVCPHWVEVAENHSGELSACLLSVPNDTFIHRLRCTIRVQGARANWMSLVLWQILRVSVHRRAGTEYQPRHRALAHDVEEVHGRDEVGAVVANGIDYRLRHRLESGEVNHRIK